jgi:hypothetical protein
MRAFHFLTVQFSFAVHDCARIGGAWVRPGQTPQRVLPDIRRDDSRVDETDLSGNGLPRE